MRGRSKQRVLGRETGEPPSLRRFDHNSPVEDWSGIKIRAEGTRRQCPMRLNRQSLAWCKENIMPIIMIIIFDAPCPQALYRLALVAKFAKNGEAPRDILAADQKIEVLKFPHRRVAIRLQSEHGSLVG